MGVPSVGAKCIYFGKLWDGINTHIQVRATVKAPSRVSQLVTFHSINLQVSYSYISSQQVFADRHIRVQPAETIQRAPPIDIWTLRSKNLVA
jgi:hypothetical protein